MAAPGAGLLKETTSLLRLLIAIVARNRLMKVQRLDQAGELARKNATGHATNAKAIPRPREAATNNQNDGRCEGERNRGRERRSDENVIATAFRNRLCFEHCENGKRTCHKTNLGHDPLAYPREKDRYDEGDEKRYHLNDLFPFCISHPTLDLAMDASEVVAG